MQENKRALVLLNMGGARNKDELKMFLTNMFNDRNILTVRSDLLRKMIAYFIVSRRLDSAWENYEHIGNASPINPLTEKLVKKCNEQIEGFKTYQAMRYTPPFAVYRDWETDRKSTRLNSSHRSLSRMPSSA